MMSYKRTLITKWGIRNVKRLGMEKTLKHMKNLNRMPLHEAVEWILNSKS